MGTEVIKVADLKVRIESLINDLIGRREWEELKKEAKEGLEEAKKWARKMASEKGKSQSTDKENKKKQLIEGLLKATIVAAKSETENIAFVPAQARAILAGLNKKNISSSSAESILVYLGDYLTGDKDIVVKGKLGTSFIRGFKELRKADSSAADLIIDALLESKAKLSLDTEAIGKLIFNTNSEQGRRDNPSSGGQENMEDFYRKFTSLNREIRQYTKGISFETVNLERDIKKKKTCPRITQRTQKKPQIIFCFFASFAFFADSPFLTF